MENVLLSESSNLKFELLSMNTTAPLIASCPTLPSKASSTEIITSTIDVFSPAEALSVISYLFLASSSLGDSKLGATMNSNCPLRLIEKRSLSRPSVIE